MTETIVVLLCALLCGAIWIGYSVQRIAEHLDELDRRDVAFLRMSQAELYALAFEHRVAERGYRSALARAKKSGAHVEPLRVSAYEHDRVRGEITTEDRAKAYFAEARKRHTEDT